MKINSFDKHTVINAEPAYDGRCRVELGPVRAKVVLINDAGEDVVATEPCLVAPGETLFWQHPGHVNITVK